METHRVTRVEYITIVVGAVIVLSWLIAAALADVLFPDALEFQYRQFQAPMSITDGTFHWLGTDHVGRDLLGLLFQGAREVLFLPIIAVLISYAVVFPIAFYGTSGDGVLSTIVRSIMAGARAVPCFVILVVGWLTWGGFVALTIAFCLGNAAGITNLVTILRGSSRETSEKDNKSRIFGYLAADVSARLSLCFAAVFTFDFLGFWSTNGWGWSAREVSVFALAFPHMIIPPLIAWVSFLLGLNLIAFGAARFAGQLIPNDLVSVYPAETEGAQGLFVRKNAAGSE